MTDLGSIEGARCSSSVGEIVVRISRASNSKEESIGFRKEHGW